MSTTVAIRERFQVHLYEPMHPNICQRITMRDLVAERTDGEGHVVLPAGTRVTEIGSAVDLEDPDNNGYMVAQIDGALHVLPVGETYPAFLMYLK